MPQPAQPAQRALFEPLPNPQRVILLHKQAPPKPEAGRACNGCGVCCAAAPCPLGIWLSRRRHGECVALSWRDEAGGQGAEGEGGRYLCGALAEPARWLPWLPARTATALARRWIAAAKGCDSDLQVG